MDYDVIIIGAGASGLMCALQAGRRKRRVLLLDHREHPGGKIPLTGGGHCNFTNRSVSAANYVSKNPHFCKSALARFTPEHFIEMLQAHQIKFHEKKHGELFCDHSARQIVEMLVRECDQGGVERSLGTKIIKITHPDRFMIETDRGIQTCASLVVATGGLSVPGNGASDLGYRIARQFGHRMIELEPALDGFVFSEVECTYFRKLAGIAVEAEVKLGRRSFRENILFTHQGLSGPAALQASLYWNKGDTITIDLLPDMDSAEWFLQKKTGGSQSRVKNLLGQLIPSRLAEAICEKHSAQSWIVSQVPDQDLRSLCQEIHQWNLKPLDTVGFSKAEVTRGGVDTDQLSSKTMESTLQPGLYFIGEVVDVTGMLGGFNLQWAWSSGWCAGQVV